MGCFHHGVSAALRTLSCLQEGTAETRAGRTRLPSCSSRTPRPTLIPASPSPGSPGNSSPMLPSSLCPYGLHLIKVTISHLNQRNSHPNCLPAPNSCLPKPTSVHLSERSFHDATRSRHCLASGLLMLPSAPRIELRLPPRPTGPQDQPLPPQSSSLSSPHPGPTLTA